MYGNTTRDLSSFWLSVNRRSKVKLAAGSMTGVTYGIHVILYSCFFVLIKIFILKSVDLIFAEEERLQQQHMQC